nr:hypothetical protein Ade03nite_14490 [Actinoplanes derwentensis]
MISATITPPVSRLQGDERRIQPTKGRKAFAEGTRRSSNGGLSGHAGAAVADLIVAERSREVKVRPGLVELVIVRN